MDSVRAVDRAIDVLRCFIGTPRGLKVAEIEQATGIARPTLYRLIRTLERRGMLRASEDPTRFELDYGVIELANSCLRGFDLGSRAEPALRKLAGLSDETVALSVYRDGKRFYIREIPANHPLSFARGVGATGTITRGATGIAILAFETPEVISGYLESVPAEHRPALTAAIEKTQSAGFAVSVNEIVDGATAVAAPIFDRYGRVIGSVGVYGPSVRLTADRTPAITTFVLDCAHEISSLDRCTPARIRSPAR